MTDESQDVAVQDTDIDATVDDTSNDDSLETLLNELDSDEETSDEKTEEVDDKQKQINDLKAELGRLKKNDKVETKTEPEEETKVEEKETPKFDVNSAMAEDLLIANNPEVKNIMPTLKAHAEKLGTTTYELFKTDPTYKQMADSFKQEEEQTEQNINKINSPSSAQFAGKSIDNVTDEDLEKMTPQQRLKVLQELQKREG